MSISFLKHSEHMNIFSNLVLDLHLDPDLVDAIQEKRPGSKMMNSNRAHYRIVYVMVTWRCWPWTHNWQLPLGFLRFKKKSSKGTVKKHTTNYNHPNWTEHKHHHSCLSFYSFRHQSCYIMASIFLNFWAIIHKPANVLHTQFTSQPELGQGQIKLD